MGPKPHRQACRPWLAPSARAVPVRANGLRCSPSSHGNRENSGACGLGSPTGFPIAPVGHPGAPRGAPARSSSTRGAPIRVPTASWYQASPSLRPSGKHATFSAMLQFAAIDFETANSSPSSACAVGVVVASKDRILHRGYWLIRPPDDFFMFTGIHGLTWADVRDAPTFEELWPELEALISDVDFLAAHNAPFDKRVLAACCEHYGLPPVDTPFICTVRLARRVWDIFPTKLPDVCRALDIPLRHHRADSDAEACARIVMAAVRDGGTL